MESTSLVILIISQVIFMAHAQLSSGITETALSSVTTAATKAPETTTQSADALCKLQTTCEDCVKVSGAKCYFCNSNATGFGGCNLYPAKNVFPIKEQCPLSDARWGVCWVNFEALIIAMSVIAGVILISVGCTVYCCCCRSRSRDDGGSEMRWERETTERQQRHADRRAEREAKMTTIRQKYGLTQETPSYNRMTDN